MTDQIPSDDYKHRSALSRILNIAASLPEKEAHAVELNALFMHDSWKKARVKRWEDQASSMIDGLTGAQNRSGILRNLNIMLDHAKRFQDVDVAVVFLDLDGFKEVNDKLGHDVGDDALKQVVQRLRVGLRHTDIVGRLGGDEFVLLLPHERDENFSEGAVRAQIRETLKDVVYWREGKPYPIGASIGISRLSSDEIGDDNNVAERLIKVADENMYKDKSEKPLRQNLAAQEALRLKNAEMNPSL